MLGPQIGARKWVRFLSEPGRRIRSRWDQLAVSLSSLKDISIGDTGFKDNVIPESPSVSPTPSPSPVRVRDEDGLQPISSFPSPFASHLRHQRALSCIVKLQAEEARHRHLTDECLVSTKSYLQKVK